MRPTENSTKIEPLLPSARGNVRVDNLTFLNAMLYVAENGCKWRALPSCYGPWNTVYRRFRRWAENGVLSKILEALVDEECERIRAGRKPLAANKLRSKKIFLNLNESELARIVEAVGTEEDLAREVRKLALEAADARLAKRS